MRSGSNKQILIILCLIFMVVIPVSGETGADFTETEDSLLIRYQSIMAEDPFSRKAAADSFYEALCTVLKMDGSFIYPFEKLEHLGKILSEDERMRVITWNIPTGYADNLYYGIIQYFSRHENKYQLVPLNEPVSTGQDGHKKEWEGSLCYSIVETRHAGQRYYTLLGFDLGDPLSNIKCIDVISIDDFDELYFTENLIRYEGQNHDRLLFEYNEKASMTLNYNKEAKMIVFDHLSPSKPSLTGQYEFYGPDFTYDGLKWEKGVWVHYPKIDVTN